MELDGSLSWLALALTPGLASRLSALELFRGSGYALYLEMKGMIRQLPRKQFSKVLL
jgi:hypothetical protein